MEVAVLETMSRKPQEGYNRINPELKEDSHMEIEQSCVAAYTFMYTTMSQGYHDIDGNLGGGRGLQAILDSRPVATVVECV
jgi:hypothetical protein